MILTFFAKGLLLLGAKACSAAVVEYADPTA